MHAIRCNDGFGKFRAPQIFSLVADKQCSFISLSIRQLHHSVNLSLQCCHISKSGHDSCIIIVTFGGYSLDASFSGQGHYFCCQFYNNLMLNQSRYIYLCTDIK